MKLPINHPGRGRRKTATTTRARAQGRRNNVVSRAWTRWAEQQWGGSRNAMCTDGRRVYDFARRLEDRGYTPAEIFQAARASRGGVRLSYVTGSYQAMRLLRNPQADAARNAVGRLDGILADTAISDQLKAIARRERATLSVTANGKRINEVIIVPRLVGRRYQLALAKDSK